MQSINIVTSITNDDIYIAFQEGKDARTKGQPYSANPYAAGPDKNATLAGSWNNGWKTYRWKDKV